MPSILLISLSLTLGLGSGGEPLAAGTCTVEDPSQAGHGQADLAQARLSVGRRDTKTFLLTCEYSGSDKVSLYIPNVVERPVAGSYWVVDLQPGQRNYVDWTRELDPRVIFGVIRDESGRETVSAGELKLYQEAGGEWTGEFVLSGASERTVRGAFRL